MKNRTNAFIFFALGAMIAGCASVSHELLSTSGYEKHITKEYLLALADRLPEIGLKTEIPVEEIWTDYLTDFGGYLQTFQYVEPENKTGPFYRIYVNALALNGCGKSDGYSKFHSIFEQWKFDANFDRFVIHYWGVMNPSETAPYVEFRLIHKQGGRVLLDARYGFYSENHQKLVEKIKRLIKAVLKKKS